MKRNWWLNDVRPTLNFYYFSASSWTKCGKKEELNFLMKLWYSICWNLVNDIDINFCTEYRALAEPAQPFCLYVRLWCWLKTVIYSIIFIDLLVVVWFMSSLSPELGHMAQKCHIPYLLVLKHMYISILCI